MARKYKDAGELQKGMVEMNLPDIKEPDTPDQTAMPMEVKLWEMNLKEYKKKVRAWSTNSDLVSTLLLGQCLQAMRNRLEAHKDWAIIDEATDVIGLLKMLQHCMGDKQTHWYPILTLMEARKGYSCSNRQVT